MFQAILSPKFYYPDLFAYVFFFDSSAILLLHWNNYTGSIVLESHSMAPKDL